jgi:hypothetical protein
MTKKFNYTTLDLHKRYKVWRFPSKTVDIYKTWYLFILLQWEIFSQGKSISIALNQVCTQKRHGDAGPQHHHHTQTPPQHRNFREKKKHI